MDNQTRNLGDKEKLRSHFLELSKRIRHRGPDWNGICVANNGNVLIGHERLSIVSPESGSQPIIRRLKSNIECKRRNL